MKGCYRIRKQNSVIEKELTGGQTLS